MNYLKVYKFYVKVKKMRLIFVSIVKREKVVDNYDVRSNFNKFRYLLYNVQNITDKKYLTNKKKDVIIYLA